MSGVIHFTCKPCSWDEMQFRGYKDTGDIEYLDEDGYWVDISDKHVDFPKDIVHEIIKYFNEEIK